MKIPFFGKVSKGGEVTSIPVSQEVIKEIARTLDYKKSFLCEHCKGDTPSSLTIHSEIKRDDGPSNYEGIHTTETVDKYGVGLNKIGHSIVESKHLNWNGLAEERGWSTSPKIKCPACRQGLTVAEYKARRAAGL